VSQDGRVIDVFKKWMTFYFEDFTEENAIFFNMFLSDLSTCSPDLSLSLARCRHDTASQMC